MFLFPKLVHDKQMEIAPNTLINMSVIITNDWKSNGNSLIKKWGKKDAKSPKPTETTSETDKNEMEIAIL